MSDLSFFLCAWARNNRWANHRLLQACVELDAVAFTARRTSFFPSIKATLNHILTVDWYYVDAMERALQGRVPNESAAAFFEPAEPFDRCPGLAQAQEAVDQRLLAVCEALDDARLRLMVDVPRSAGICPERMDRLLAHLFQHQIHHRGQVHAMLAGTDVAPPQLDEFFCASDRSLRADDLTALGWDEAGLWKR
ncbi:DinB family protein [Eleftheria terrae]|uniref:DinB family protein n=1 Tax=Eleftheria terrae TaxID=1597781 RepID=UPI00263AF4DF|nr:DinB family protein [Eleftheria terrae]WKB51219.1 DinB family protein [Eleftheria terrae]